MSNLYHTLQMLMLLLLYIILTSPDIFSHRKKSCATISYPTKHIQIKSFRNYKHLSKSASNEMCSNYTTRITLLCTKLPYPESIILAAYVLRNSSGLQNGHSIFPQSHSAYPSEENPDVSAKTHNNPHSQKTRNSSRRTPV